MLKPKRAQRAMADPAALLMEVELMTLGEKPVAPEQRHGAPVLLERERLDKRSESLALRAGEAKLVASGVFWMASGKSPEDKEETFTADRSPGLSKLEEDIIRIQAKTYLEGRMYHSVLLDIPDLESIKHQCTVEGTVDQDRFLERTLVLAMQRDDELDSVSR